MSDDELGYDFPGAPQQVEFWSLAIPPNKTVQAKLSLLPGQMEIAHATSAALDEHAKPGRHVVKIIPIDETGEAKPEVALGTLELGRTDQFAVDFGFSSTMGFRHTGKSTVHLSGYMTRSYGVDEDEQDYDSESESESESDDAEPPFAVPLQQNGKVTPVKGPNKPTPAAAANGPAAAAAGDSSSEEDESEEGESDEDESDDEEGGEDEDMMGDEYDRRLGAKSFGAAGGSSSSDGEDESDDEGESESDDPMNIGSDDMVAGVEYADVEAEEEDEGESDDDEDESSDDDDEEDDEEDESSDDEPQQQQFAKGKRPASQPMTPQPKAAKKQKGNEGKPVPVSAPAKGPVAKTGGDPASQYLSALVNELKKSGSMQLSTLASKVKKPHEVSAKFKVFLSQHDDTFSLNGDNVSLKKK